MQASLSSRPNIACRSQFAAGAAATSKRSRCSSVVVAGLATEKDNPFAEELKANAKHISRRGRGILASDESNATTGKRLETIGVDNTEDNRRDWRQLLYTAPGEPSQLMHPSSLSAGCSSMSAPYASFLCAPAKCGTASCTRLLPL